jgi:hypothetical protein
MPRRRIDWAEIRIRYINGNGTCTFATLAPEFGVPDTVRRRGAREHWTAGRQARADAVVKHATEQFVWGASAKVD